MVMVTANGDQDSPIPQRVFWALAEGAVASVLIGTGGPTSASALRAVAIVGGLPLTLFLCLQCIGLLNALKDDMGEIKFLGGPFWEVHLLDFLDKPTWSSAKKVTLHTVAPWYGIFRVAKAELNDLATGVMSAVFFNMFILSYIIQGAGVSGMWGVAWASFFFFVGLLTSVRARLRRQNGIVGEMVTDFFASLLVPMLTVHQLYEHSRTFSPYSNMEPVKEGANTA